MLTSSVSLIAETRGSQLQRRDERWVAGTLTLSLNMLLVFVAEAEKCMSHFVPTYGGTLHELVTKGSYPRREVDLGLLGCDALVKVRVVPV